MSGLAPYLFDRRFDDLVALGRSLLPALAPEWMDQAAWSTQLDARELVRHYVEALWQDVQRAGESPEIGEKYRALAIVRELVRSLTVVAFDVTHDGAVAESGG